MFNLFNKENFLRFLYFTYIIILEFETQRLIVFFSNSGNTINSAFRCTTLGKKNGFLDTYLT